VLEQVGTGTIVNDDDAPVDIAIGDATVTEGDSGSKSITFTISLSQESTSAVTFQAATANGTATSGSDYVAKALAADSIPAGQLSKTYTVVVKGDTVVEGNEVLYANLYNVSGANVVDATGIGTILNDDGPLLSIADAFVAEGNSGTKVLTFTVSLSQAAAVAVTYDIATANGTATAGVDYVANALSGQSIPAGQRSKTFSVTLNGDTTVEPNESLRVNLSNGSVTIADNQGTGILINDDGPTLSIADAGFVEGNAGSKDLLFTVSLSQVSAVDVTVEATAGGGTATAGADYVAAWDVLTIPAGQLSQSFAVPVYGDTAVEGNETFFVALSNATVSIADSQARATLTNDDGPTLSIGDASLSEPDSGSTMMTFTVTLSQVAAAPVSFNFSTGNGTALSGPDYVAVNVTGLKIPAGQLSKVISVPIKGDLLVEPNETLSASISLGNVSITDGVGVGTIVNDD
jgi:hypothetical protein